MNMNILQKRCNDREIISKLKLDKIINSQWINSRYDERTNAGLMGHMGMIDVDDVDFIFSDIYIELLDNFTQYKKYDADKHSKLSSNVFDEVLSKFANESFSTFIKQVENPCAQRFRIIEEISDLLEFEGVA